MMTKEEEYDEIYRRCASCARGLVRTRRTDTFGKIRVIYCISCFLDRNIPPIPPSELFSDGQMIFFND